MGMSGDLSPRDDFPRDGRIKGNGARTATQQLTVVLFPLLWGFGFVCSRWRGCDTDLALSKATAYALTGFVGWLTYLLIWRPRSFWPVPCCTVWGAQPSLLGPTINPWPFLEMLKFGLVYSLAFALLTGLLFRFLRPERFLARQPAGKEPIRSSAHPLSDDQVG